jgi:hypothetical protein
LIWCAVMWCAVLCCAVIPSFDDYEKCIVRDSNPDHRLGAAKFFPWTNNALHLSFLIHHRQSILI